MDISRTNEFWVFGFGVRAISGDTSARPRQPEGEVLSPRPRKDSPEVITLHEERGRWVSGSKKAGELIRAETRVHPLRDTAQTYDLAGKPSPARAREGSIVDIYA